MKSLGKEAMSRIAQEMGMYDKWELLQVLREELSDGKTLEELISLLPDDLAIESLEDLINVWL